MTPKQARGLLEWMKELPKRDRRYELEGGTYGIYVCKNCERRVMAHLEKVDEVASQMPSNCCKHEFSLLKIIAPDDFY